jgi:hypothetical protein
MPGRNRQRAWIPKTKLHWQVFFNDHLPPKRCITIQIGDPEATGTKHTLDHEFLKPRSGGQSLANGCRFL